jgi:hypothetical protein
MPGTIFEKERFRILDIWTSSPQQRIAVDYWSYSIQIRRRTTQKVYFKWFERRLLENCSSRIIIHMTIVFFRRYTISFHRHHRSLSFGRSFFTLFSVFLTELLSP